MAYFRTLRRKIGTAIGISALVHLIIYLLCLRLVPETPIIPKEATVVELTDGPELPRRPKQAPKDEKDFVRSAPAPEDQLTKEKKEKRFASEDEQNVIEERRARDSGMTENRAPGQAAKESEEKRPSTNRKDLNFKPESPLERLAENEGEPTGDIAMNKEEKEQGAVNTGKPLDLSRFGSIERGVSTVGESLPDDIKFGDFTALNTDRHLYYTFYSRIEEMIRGRWVNYVKATLYGMETGSIGVPAQSDWTTKLEIILDSNGTFRKAILHESSGSRNLDSAPVQAFRDARQFPNPPAEMVKDDGAIHLLYAFTVNVVPRYAAGRSE